MASPMRQTSGTYNYAPTGAEVVLEGFSRCGMRGPELRVEHLIEARRSLNLIMQRASVRGVNLWAVGDKQLVIPMTPAIATYALPTETVTILDAYRRIYQPNSTFTTLGNALTAVLANGQPVITAQGDPVVLGPGSGTLSTIAGSQEVGLHWPSHGLVVGSPLFWNIPTSVGGLVLSNFNVVDQVIDQNNVTFQSATPALWTSALQGATPLFATVAGSAVIDCILPNHGYSIGNTFSVQVATTVGGITIPAGSYVVTAVPTTYDFQFAPAVGNATSNDAQFENSGQIKITSQTTGTQWTDIFMWPLSRDDYAMLPNKEDPGPPTQYWFNRTINPSITVWPVPPVPPQGQPNEFIAFVAYRMRKLQDANPIAGQTLDLPSRFYEWICAALAAAVAEKYQPAMHPIKLALAKDAWEEAAGDDRERVSAFIVGDFTGYFE